MAGQIAMITSPLAMGALSKFQLNMPFFVSACSGVLVILCMILITQTSLGLNAGRISRAQIELIEKKDDELNEVYDCLFQTFQLLSIPEGKI